MTLEVDKSPFDVTRRGYDRAQVDGRLGELGTELAAALAARDSALDDARTLTRRLDASQAETEAARAATAEARAELEKLRAQVAELSVVPSSVDGMSERLQQMVRIAQEEVNDMRSRATTSAAHVLSLAQAEADELRERSAAERRAFEAEHKAAEEALRAQLEESRARLDQLRNDSEGQKARLDAELAEHRKRTEQEFAAEAAERRAAMQREFEVLETRNRDEAARMLKEAAYEARTHLAEATEEAQRVRSQALADVEVAHRELAELRALQHQVSEQLTSVRALLDWTLPQLAHGDGGTARPAAAAVPVPAARRVPIAAGTAGTGSGNGTGTADGGTEPGLGTVDSAADAVDGSGTDTAATDAAPARRPTPTPRGGAAAGAVAVRPASAVGAS